MPFAGPIAAAHELRGPLREVFAPRDWAGSSARLTLARRALRNRDLYCGSICCGQFLINPKCGGESRLVGKQRSGLQLIADRPDLPPACWLHPRHLCRGWLSLVLLRPLLPRLHLEGVPAGWRTTDRLREPRMRFVHFGKPPSSARHMIGGPILTVGRTVFELSMGLGA